MVEQITIAVLGKRKLRVTTVISFHQRLMRFDNSRNVFVKHRKGFGKNYTCTAICVNTNNLK